MSNTYPSARPGPAPSRVRSGYGGSEPDTNVSPGAFRWCGYTWEPMDWGIAPGQPKRANVSVTPSGQLVLSAGPGSDGYTGAEVDSARGDTGIAGNASTWGYGTYKWVIRTDLSTMPAGLVLGLFTYWAQSKGGPPGQKEIDLEVSTFAIQGAPTFVQMGFYQDTPAAARQAVPPGQTMVSGSQVPVKSSPATTVQFTWLPGSITWHAWYAATSAGTPDVSLVMTHGEAYTWTQPYGGNRYAGTVQIPATGGQQVIMNLWCANASPPPRNAPFQVVLDSFSYTQPSRRNPAE